MTMNLTEPMTMLTDCVLGLSSAWWSMRLRKCARRDGQKSIALWSAGFFGFALASFAAGTYHGLGQELEPSARASLWIFVALAMAVASGLMLCAAVIVSTSGAMRRALVVASIAKALAFAILGTQSDEYLLVIVDYGSAQLLILTLAAIGWRRDRAPSAPWIAAGVAVSAIAAGVQQSGFALHEHFNHNDLYHVIQLLGLYLLYRGGALYRDRA